MHEYDPDVSPTADEWLQLDETERLELVRACHRLMDVPLPNAELHSVIHTVVENQLALGQEAVADVLTRLQAEGLSRHDAIHAIGSVLAEHLYALMQEGSDKGTPAYIDYLQHLGRLTAASWKAT
jgi:hypothetical protein